MVAWIGLAAWSRTYFIFENVEVLDEVKLMLKEYDPMVLCCQETYLKPNDIIELENICFIISTLRVWIGWTIVWWCIRSG